MTKEELIALQISAKKFRPENSRAAKHLLFDASLVVAGIFLSVSEHFHLWALGQGVMFICVWRNFSIMHTCVHNSFFANREWNTWTGYLCSILALVPYGAWKQAHLDHHNWVGSREKDPSLRIPLSHELSPFQKRLLNICWKLHVPIFSVYVTTLKKSSAKKKKLDLSGHFLWGTHLILILALKLMYLKIFLLPFLLYLFTSDLVVIAQHNMLSRDKIPLSDFPLPLHRHHEVTREVAMPRFFGKHVLLNFDKHLLHHYLPSTPHYRLLEVEFKNGEREDWWLWLKRVHRLEGKDVYLD